ncbi:probable 3-beta-hydroxysteroid-Delta(8),Delta(7)-isomerase [Cornus florida]|uniref:probable 3-beta-hydroxysteroid-Delta(8),Delta(7)-isomerase n=1 Tax=Cornus florida TaxID=4283 RepID=UPI002897906F|nr:probable 3-beta-hydroxysteroid-Delta(8),Delta(7)-isomerase [Cornus florida]
MEGAQSQPHPYVPRDLNLPDYVPVVLSQSTIVGVYGLSSLLIVFLVWLLSGRLSRARKLDRVLMCWWVFTGLTHMILEGYFVFSPEFYKDKTACYLAEVWKEYSKGDSRYAGRDSGVVSVEGITAVLEGPACLLAVYAIATRKSYSYVLQLAISLGQLYGTAVYFITSYLEGDNFATSTYYYYAYYIVANASWVVIPTLISIRCWKKICAAFQVQDQKKAKIR